MLKSDFEVMMIFSEKRKRPISKMKMMMSKIEDEELSTLAKKGEAPSL